MINTRKNQIRVSNLSTGYGGKRVLSGIDINMNAGSFFIIAGPNGTGKTTLLKCLVGLRQPETGGVYLGGTHLKQFGRQELARNIAYLPQTVESAFSLTVREVVLMGRAPHSGLLGLYDEQDMHLAEEAMAFTDVSHLHHRSLETLSGGERQRVFISRAVCQQPAFILLDEPTSALDLANQVRIMDLMERLKEVENMGIIMVSHDLNLASMYADTLCLIHGGKVAGLGTPAEVLEQKLLESVYHCPLTVEKGEATNHIRVTPLPGRLW